MANKPIQKSEITSVVAKEANGNVQITFTIPYALVKNAEEETIKEFAKDIVVPGFRKGNAPLEKVREKVQKNELIQHALGHILPPALAEAVEKNKLRIAIYPKFELIKSEENENWEVRGTTCELPEIDLGNYKEAIKGAFRASNLWTPAKGEPEKPKEPTREEKEQLVVKTLLESIKIDVPQILIEEESDSRLSNLLARLEKLGLALESYLASSGKKPEDLKAEYAIQAKEAISLDLILTKIAEVEGLKVDEKEVEEALKMSQNTNTAHDDPESRKRLITSILKRRMALDFLINLTS